MRDGDQEERRTVPDPVVAQVRPGDHNLRRVELAESQILHGRWRLQDDDLELRAIAVARSELDPAVVDSNDVPHRRSSDTVAQSHCQVSSVRDLRLAGQDGGIAPRKRSGEREHLAALICRAL
eukprot:2844855-Rhodomonas_salina.4